MAPDGSGARPVLRDSDGLRHSLDFAPDGRRLAFVELEAGNTYEAETNVRTIELRSGETTRIPQRISQRVFAATWAPGGKRIAFAHRRVVFDPNPRFVGMYGVSTIRPGGTDRHPLFSLPRYENRPIDELSWRPRR